MSQFGRGYRPDPATHRRTHIRATRLGLHVLPSKVDLRPFAPPVMDQAQTSACTGHALACAIYTSYKAAGSPLPWVPSPDGIYKVGRAIDRADPSVPLADVGAQPNQVVRGTNEYGIHAIRPLADRYSDADPATINDEPTLGDLAADSRQLVIGDYAAWTPDDVALALSNGIACTAAIAADGNAFQGYTGGVLGPQGYALDHYIALLGYETTASGRVWYLRNSWGAWGLSGEALIDDDCIAQLGDIYALKVKS